jgi:hypothetical protein
VVVYSVLEICHLSEERFGSIFMAEGTLSGGSNRYLKKIKNVYDIIRCRTAQDVILHINRSEGLRTHKLTCRFTYKYVQSLHVALETLMVH